MAGAAGCGSPTAGLASEPPPAGRDIDSVKSGIRIRSATGMILEVSRSPTGMISNVAAIVLERIFAFNRAEPADE